MAVCFEGFPVNKTVKSGGVVIFVPPDTVLQSFKITRFLAFCIKEPFPCGAVFCFREMMDREDI